MPSGDEEGVQKRLEHAVVARIGDEHASARNGDAPGRSQTVGGSVLRTVAIAARSCPRVLAPQRVGGRPEHPVGGNRVPHHDTVAIAVGDEQARSIGGDAGGIVEAIARGGAAIGGVTRLTRSLPPSVVGLSGQGALRAHDCVCPA